MRTAHRFVVSTICFGICAAFWALAQVPNPSRPLSEWLPGGALFYLESSDFGSQLRDWNRSDVKAKWLVSKNHEEFMTTRLMLKLKDVYEEFSAAAGFQPDLRELETVAGTQSAIAVYDIRQLDFVYISRLPAAQLGANVFTRVRSSYETRAAAGQSYFARQSGGRTAAFAIAGEYVVASTREDLLSTALELIQGGTARVPVSQEPWSQDALRALPADATGPAYLRLVMDLASVIKTPYFRSYWIQRNTNDLQTYYAFLTQVNRKTDAFEETRVLLRSDEAQAPNHAAATTDLQRFVPDGVGLFRLWDTPSANFALRLIRQKFFDGPVDATRRNDAPTLSFDGFAGAAGDFQTRIDEPPKPSLAGELILEPLKGLLESAGLEAVLHLESTPATDDSVFVRSDAAIALRGASAWDADAVRAALTSAVASYQSVGNIGLQWRNVAAAGATVSQWNGLLPLTVYVDGQTLWIARSPRLIGNALEHASSVARPSQTGGYLARYNHGTELSPYLRMMRMLDLSNQSNYSSFFSENVGSLALSLNSIESVSVTVNDSGLVQRQFLRYELAR